jgi:hypothetical protein
VSDEEDWRVAFAHHLRELTLERQNWVPRSATWDHDHCAACQAKLGPDDGMLAEGYATRTDYKFGARYDWVCPDCFDALKGPMDWKAA